MLNYFYSHAGQQYGPASGQQLKELAAQGHITPEDYVWQEGGSKRFLARDIKGLFFLAIPPPPPPIACESRPPEAEVVSDAEYIPCPHCLNFVITDPSLAGQTVQCPHCSQIFQFPGSTASIIPPPIAAAAVSSQKPQSIWNETLGELRMSVKGTTKKATKIAIKVAIGFACLFGICSGLALIGHFTDSLSQPVKTGVIPSSGRALTKSEFEKRLREAGWRGLNGGNDLIKTDELRRLFGQPDKTQRLGDSLYWYWQCQDGAAQLVTSGVFGDSNISGHDEVIVENCNFY